MPTRKSSRRPCAALALAVLGLVAAGLSGCLTAGPEPSSWALAMTQLDDVPGDGSGVTVAVLDTGVNVGHPNLRHLANGDEGDGELVAYRDFLDGRQGVAAAEDRDGHGTHVVSIIAARPTGGVRGVALEGAAPGVRLVVARVCTTDSCPPSAVASGVRWAVGQGADVLSLSLGGQAGLPPALADALGGSMADAVDAAVAAGVVVVASAGNCGDASSEGCDGADDVNVPASVAGVIAVGAVDEQGRVAGFSSHGGNDANPCRPLPIPGLEGRCDPDRKPELVAPGVGILGAWTGSGYATLAGTSQATPFVTSAVAQMLAGQPAPNDRGDVEKVKQALVDSAKAVSGQQRPHDDAAGYGLLQARGAYDKYR